MKLTFESHGCVYDAECYRQDATKIIRFYVCKNEQYAEPLNDLVIVIPSYGFLMLQYIGEDAVLSGTLDSRYFCKDMIEDILHFVEDIFPECKNVYLPYHIDFVTVSEYDEYNGEY